MLQYVAVCCSYMLHGTLFPPLRVRRGSTTDFGKHGQTNKQTNTHTHTHGGRREREGALKKYLGLMEPGLHSLVLGGEARVQEPYHTPLQLKGPGFHGLQVLHTARQDKTFVGTRGRVKLRFRQVSASGTIFFGRCWQVAQKASASVGKWQKSSRQVLD